MGLALVALMIVNKLMGITLELLIPLMYGKANMYTIDHRINLWSRDS